MTEGSVLRDRPVLAVALIAGATVLSAAALVAAVLAYPATAEKHFVLAVGTLIGAAVFVLARGVDPAITVSVGLGLAIFSGSWSYMGFPFGVDRLILGLAVIVVILEAIRSGTHKRFVLRPIHWFLALASLFGIGSALWAGTLTEGSAFFELLDRFGLVPFALFLVAPVVFDTPERREILLRIFLVLGAYLGFTALAEGLGANALVFPTYITDASLGTHADRARGPFLEAGANGHALYVCAVAAAIAFITWKRTGLRVLAAAIALACVAGCLFTLTRQIWLAAVVATFITLIAVSRLRRLLLPAFVATVLLVLGLLNFVPSLSGEATTRFESEAPIWDRLNSNQAALNMVEDRPLLGFGWATFKELSEPYYEQASGYPLTSVSHVHNVFLSNAAELGLVGTTVWVIALVLAFGGAFLKRGPPEQELWRAGLIATFVSWLVIANFTPLTYGFSNYVVWLWAGVLFANFTADTPHD